MTQHNEDVPVITIDGPSGSGKGTIAQLVANKLGWHLLDSGALYRLLALCATHHGVAFSNEASLRVLAEHMDVQFTSSNNQIKIVLEGEDVSRDIRAEEIGKAASEVAAWPQVRLGLLTRQHAFQEKPGLVADGRDMGTIVFPRAPLKIFLTASVEERAQRRYKQLKEKGFDASLSTLLDEIRARDERDTNRSVAPLKPAKDAIVVDSTEMSIDSVFALVMSASLERKLA